MSCLACILMVIVFPQHPWIIAVLAVLGAFNESMSLQTTQLVAQERASIQSLQEYFHIIEQMELLGKAVSIGIVFLAGKYEFIIYLLPIVFVLGIANFFGMDYFINLFPRKTVLQSEEASVFQGYKKAFLALSSNQLWKIGVLLFCLHFFMKFFVEFSFYNVAQTQFQSPESYSQFISSFQLLQLSLSFLITAFAGSYIVNQVPMSTAVSALPISLIILSLVVVLTGASSVVLMLNLILLVLTRVSYRPAIRMCISTASPLDRIRLNTLTNVITSVLALIFVYFRSYLGSEFDIMDSIYVLIIVSVVVVMLSLQMDSYYLKNLWEQIKSEILSPELNTDLQTEIKLEAVPFKNKGTVKSFEELEDYLSNNVLSEESAIGSLDLLYQASRSVDQTMRAARLHMKYILETKNPIFYELFHKFRPDIRDQVLHKLADKIDGHTHRIWKYIIEVSMKSKTPILSQRQISDFLFYTLSQKSFSPFLSQFMHVLHWSPDLQRDFIEQLVRPGNSLVHPYFFECIDEKNEFNIKPMLENLMLNDNVHESQLIRDAIGSLSKHAESHIQDFINERILNKNSLTRFDVLNLIFLTETIIKPKALSKNIRDSVFSFYSGLDKSELKILVNMHLRFMRKSPHFLFFKSHLFSII